ncbi:hypothetical protein, partial [Prochlorothrix hollandica]|uniref:hypothetical protein n=1 Tax=Prochlorothrix hollandica TaxID=1223 RepID=UPI00334193A7
GVLDRVRNSFHSPNNANVHCMVMQYGKGKSHLGLVLANFFSKTYDSPEVQGILHQITQATVAHPAIGQSIDSFKKNQSKPHLVLCLSGDWGGSDLRQHIFNCLLKTLHQAGLDPAPLNLCAEPLRYLAKVQASPAKEDKANAFLHQKAETGETEYDIQSLVSLLRQNTTEVIPLVKEICRHLEGFAPDFNPDINVTELLTAFLETYCKGNEAPFKGMLIIFDEMNYYLNFWKSNEIAAGGTALQNITNLCENYKGILALLSFTQIRFRTEVGSNVNSRDSYLRISTRIAPKDATYEPRSSLELVLDNLLVQQEHTEAWKEFEQKWRETFTAEARYLYEGSGKNYLTQGWTEQQVRQTLSAGCFPLHPYTTYLLANLSFTQDRTAIQFLRSTVTDFINSEPAETPGGLRPNYLYATTLVDSFLENYNSTLQEQYKTALQLLSGSDNDAEYQVVRALFLYGASEGKLTKTHDQEDHKVILGHLTGLGPLQLNAALDRLTNHYRALYHNPASKLYSFYQGANPTMLEDEIDRRIANLTSSIEEVVSHAQSKLSTYLSTNTLPGIAFVETKRLVEKDWEFEQRFVSPDSLTRLLTNAHSLQNVTQRGLVVYVLAETQEELQSLNRTLDTRLSQSPVGDRIVVAIPSMATDDLDRLLLKRQTLSKMDFEERRNYGEAYSQLLSQWDRDIQTSLQQILKNCTYHCRDMASLTSQERQQAHALVSHLLTQ